MPSTQIRQLLWTASPIEFAVPEYSDGEPSHAPARSSSALLSKRVSTLMMCQQPKSGCMPAAPADVRTLDDLRNFIHLALCKKENLLEHHFPMTELKLHRGQTHCGSQFILHGPRSVKLSAVWDRRQNTVLLYDALGRRFARVRIPNEVIQ